MGATVKWEARENAIVIESIRLTMTEQVEVYNGINAEKRTHLDITDWQCRIDGHVGHHFNINELTVDLGAEKVFIVFEPEY